MRGNADADSQINGCFASADREGSNGPPHALCEHCRLIRPVARQCDHELLATEPAQNIAASKFLRHGFGNGPERQIADRVSPTVVDGLEVIEVEDKERGR